MKKDGGSWPALVGLGFAVLGASCALPFWSLPADEGTSGSSTPGSPSPDGAPCSADDECLDGHCLPSNDGNGNVCCALDCTDKGVGSCFTNGNCDPGGSSCALYPTGAFCGTTTCDGGILTGDQCRGGACGPGDPVPCPGGLVCDSTTACKTTCMTNQPEDCRTQGAHCPYDLSPICVAAPAGTPCDSDEECMYQCGTNHSGHCCAASCPYVGPPCGAIDCDASGKCVYPGGETACGPTSSCNGTELTSAYCNQSGACTIGSVEKPCPGNLRCDALSTSCYADCGLNDQSGDLHCAAGYYCNGLGNGKGCVPGEPDGSPCARPGQCASGKCFIFGPLSACFG